MLICCYKTYLTMQLQIYNTSMKWNLSWKFMPLRIQRLQLTNFLREFYWQIFFKTIPSCCWLLMTWTLFSTLWALLKQPLIEPVGLVLFSKTVLLTQMWLTWVLADLGPNVRVNQWSQSFLIDFSSSCFIASLSPYFCLFVLSHYII